MVVFGGFVRGERSNSTVIYDYDTKKWTELTPQTDDLPFPRAGHASLVYDDMLYVFGGKNEDNVKLNDFWCLDLNTHKWISLPNENPPQQRSGHTICEHEGSIYLFGGIFEITKELNDMHSYNV
jgi:N-acetylneuraminic acid mutarotase